MKKESKVFKILQKASKILSWVIITMLIIVILFLVVVVVSTKVNEKLGKEPVFSLYTIISPSMIPNINVYDVIFVSKVDPDKLKVKDVISFRVKNSTLGKTPVTHRIVKIETTGTGERSYITKGDRNTEEDKWRYPVTDSDIVGKVIFKIPQLGRLQFFLTSKTGWFIVILLPALAIIAFDLFKLMKLVFIKAKITDERENKILNSDNFQEKVIEEITEEEPKAIVNEEIKEPEGLSFNIEENKVIGDTPSIMALPFDNEPVSTPVLEVKENNEVSNELNIQNIPAEKPIEITEELSTSVPFETKPIEPVKEELKEIEYSNYQSPIVTIEPVQNSEEKQTFETIDK